MANQISFEALMGVRRGGKAEAAQARPAGRRERTRATGCPGGEERKPRRCCCSRGQANKRKPAGNMVLGMGTTPSFGLPTGGNPNLPGTPASLSVCSFHCSPASAFPRAGFSPRRLFPAQAGLLCTALYFPDKSTGCQCRNHFKQKNSPGRA
jgi:hypothetical protein